jgi:hypothetical protein
MPARILEVSDDTSDSAARRVTASNGEENIAEATPARARHHGRLLR